MTCAEVLAAAENTAPHPTLGGVMVLTPPVLVLDRGVQRNVYMVKKDQEIVRIEETGLWCPVGNLLFPPKEV